MNMQSRLGRGNLFYAGRIRSYVEVERLLERQLTGEALKRGLAAAQAMEREWTRERALAAFLPVASDPSAVLHGTRQASADHLLKNLSAARREEVLRFCAHEELSAPPILDQGTLVAIAGHIVEVCQDWRWM